jgi:hypothetical protein
VSSCLVEYDKLENVNLKYVIDLLIFNVLSVQCTEVVLSIIMFVSSGAANKIEIAAADNYLSSRDH